MEPARERRAWLRAWLVVGLAAWAELGAALIDRVNGQAPGDGIVADSPVQFIAFAALLALGLYSTVTFLRGLRHLRWRQSFPPRYGGVGLSFVVLLAFFPLSLLWRGAVGAPRGIENGIGPVALLIPVGFVLLAIGPVREAIAIRRAATDVVPDRRVAWAGAVAVGLLGGALTFQPFEPIRDPLNDLAWNAGRDVSEIWSMASDGSAQTRLLIAVGDGVDYSLPAAAPDGQRIAFTRWANNGGAAQSLRAEDQSAAVWTMAADGSHPRLLVEGAPDLAWIPAYSPDGQWVAYTVSPQHPVAAAAPAAPQPGGLGSPASAAGASIWIVHPDGTDVHRLSPEGGDASAAAWSPDGARIAFASLGAGGTGDIHVATVTESGLAEDIVIAADPAEDCCPTWTPDGQLILFTSGRSGNDDVWAASADGSGAVLRQLTDDPAADWVPAAAADGTRIAFVSDRSGDPEVWVMNADGTDPRNVSNHPLAADGQWSVAWTPDGSHLLFAEAAFQDAASSGWVREDLAAAKTAAFAVVLAIMALLLVAMGAPLGAFTVALSLIVGLLSISTDQWRFLPAAFIGGVLVDVTVASVRSTHRSRVAAAALAAAGCAGIGATLAVQGTLEWSPTLFLGVVGLAAVIGWGIAELVERLLAPQSPAGTDAAT